MAKKHILPPPPEFFGATVVGERGQTVIPAEARKTLDLKKGEKLLVFGLGDRGLCLTKLSGLEKFEKHLAESLVAIREMIRKSK